MLSGNSESSRNWDPNTVLGLEPKPLAMMCVKPSLNDTIRLLCEKDTYCHCVAKCLPRVTSCLNFFLPHQLCCGFQWIALELYILCPYISYPGRLLMDDIWNCPSFHLKKKATSSFNLFRDALSWSP